MSKATLTVLMFIVSLWAAAYFTATQPITTSMAIVSSVAVVGFAVPSYYGVLYARGKKRGLILIGAISAYALVLESSAIHTGFPYGHFVYSDLLGGKVFGLTPWTVAFAYPPILLLSYWFARQITSSRILVYTYSALCAVSIDLVLDPASVARGFWYWDVPGVYYGVPLINFAGWLLSAFLGTVILHAFLSKKTTLPRSLAYSGLAILWFWTCVNLWLGQWIPVAVGAVQLLILCRLIQNRYNKS